MTCFYNDHEPYVAQWLRNLITAGELLDGVVDERSIADLKPADVAGYEQAHFFDGIGGWPYALKLAGWRGPVWTASLPCPSFSAAGKRGGVADARHLWPAFYALVRELRPATIFGEQVEGAIGFGWLDGIFADLEGCGYACGAAVLPAAGVGAPHIRSRLYWVADAGRISSAGRRDVRDVGETSARNESESQERQRLRNTTDDSGADGGLGDSDGARPQGHGRPEQRISERSPWEAGELIQCLDGKARRVEPGVFPLADGVSARVGKLRAYGNAIVPQVAAEFVRAFIES